MSLLPRDDVRPPARRLLAAATVALALVATALALPGAGRGQQRAVAGAAERGRRRPRAACRTPTRRARPAHTHDPASRTRWREAARPSPRAPSTPPPPRSAATPPTSSSPSGRCPTPTLVPVPFTRPRTYHPVDRYAMANGCYTLRTPAGLYLRRNPQAYPMSRIPARRAARFFFKATDLGTYLLLGRTGRGFLSGGTPDGTTPGAVAGRPDPSPRRRVDRHRRPRRRAPRAATGSRCPAAASWWWRTGGSRCAAATPPPPSS